MKEIEPMSVAPGVRNTIDARAISRSFCGSLIVCMALLVGCGGGGGSPAGNSKATARKRVVATTRIEQATFAIVGLGRPITRAPRPRLGLIALIPRSRGVARDVVQGQDAGTGLYFTRTINADGSGRLDLFLDAARSSSAGNMTWAGPQWNGGQLNSYPAVIHTSFQLTGGKYAGDRGTLDITPQDATGNNETLHLVLTDAQNETVIADFKVVNGVLTGKTSAVLADGTQCTASDSIGLDGVLDILISFVDGSQESLTTEPDGTGTETYDSPDGSQEATGNFDDNTGDDTIDYSDGSSETVNVDDSNSDTNNGN
jgi:hypothetical protein